MTIVQTARGPFWQSQETPSLWFSQISNWKKAMISWKSAALKPHPYGNLTHKSKQSHCFIDDLSLSLSLSLISSSIPLIKSVA
ncbi:hypothetical protein NXF25_002477 [Crotalus adamanteus]|uniref:Uncharacterized protein n=1 Tax=Crotalus adamanteus TaxID=8729 RepID=A0AAW1CB85_CROAD